VKGRWRHLLRRLRAAPVGTERERAAPRRGARRAIPSSGVAEHGAARLHYENAGEGPAVLLVGGLAMTAAGWWRTVPVLAEDFRVLTFDNRGTGRSASAGASDSVAEMADDAAAVLSAAGVERAHVYGISLGGMVAQELALRHPERVDALVLGATTPGSFLAAPPDAAVLAAFLRHRSLRPDEAVWGSVPHLYARETQVHRPERIAEDVARRLEEPVAHRTYTAQVAAGMRHDALSRLGAISAPTLVVHGQQDRVVPPANARTLAAGIPDAELHLWPGAGHLYMTDEPRADPDVADFLARLTRSRVAGAGSPARGDTVPAA
jgi:pimeloyl-ACP methyl ester carboxylesterase